MNPWSCGWLYVEPPAATALPTISSTPARLSSDRHSSTSVLFVASQIGFGVKARNLSCVSSMTKILSLTTMHAAVSSVNCALKPKPSWPKKAIDFLRSDTGKLTNICAAIVCSNQISIRRHDLGKAPALVHAARLIIQPTPKRSVSIPKRGDQNVLASGICTCPPSASAANIRSAWAASVTVRDSENPWKPGCPEQVPSDAMTTASPIRKQACMTLFSDPGGSIPGGGGSGLSL